MPKILGSGKTHSISETTLGSKRSSLSLYFCFLFSHLHYLEKFRVRSVGLVAMTLGIAQSPLFCGLTVLRNKAETYLK